MPIRVMSPHTHLSRLRILRAIGIAALLPSIIRTIFLVLFALGNLQHNNSLAVICLITTVFDILCNVQAFYLLIRPSSLCRLFGVIGALSALVSGVLAAISFGWMSLSGHLPEKTAGQDTKPMLIAGFSVFILTVVLQSVFWTYVLARTKEPQLQSVEDGIMPQQAMVHAPRRPTDSTVAFQPSSPPATTSPHMSTASTIRRDSGRLSFLMHVSSKGKLRTSLQKEDVTEPATSPPPNEVNHFDNWETSDNSVRERVEASLAIVESENIVVDHELDIAPAPVEEPTPTSLPALEEDYINYTHTSKPTSTKPERIDSPPLPDSGTTPRGHSCPPPSPGRLPQSPRRSSPVREPALVYLPGGTGKWLAGMKSRNST